MLYVSWSNLKSFWSANSDKIQLNYIEFDNKYIAWCQYRNLEILCDTLFKDGDDGEDFEDNYKSLANTQEADKFRITTARIGSRLTFHFVEFTTAKLNSVDNENINGQDDGSVTLKIYDVNGDETQTENSAVETHLLFAPEFAFEIAGGSLKIPGTLAGNDDDAWEIFGIGSPGVINHEYVRHAHLSWFKGETIELDSSVDPGELPNIEVNGVKVNRIKIIVKHPAGAQTKFLMQYRYFRICV